MCACCVSDPIKLKDSLISNNTGKNQLMSYGENQQIKVAFKTTTLGWVWPGVSLDESDFRILDHQHLWKKIIDTFV